jgi:hypothetical protein
MRTRIETEDLMEAYNDIGLLDKNKLLEIFDYLNQQLKENAMQLELTIYGGCIMTMVFDNRPATKDIDCVFSLANDKLLEHILKNTQFVFDLSDGWINDEIKEPLKSIIAEELETFKTYSNLKILKPKAEQLLAMKVLAARPEPAKDFTDAALLCKTLNIATKAQLLAIIKGFVPLRLLGERQINFIKYLGEDLGYDWQ